MVTRNYRGSRGVTGVMASFKGLQVVTGGYKVTRLQGYKGYKLQGLQGLQGYKGLQRVTKGYKGLQRVTRGYKVTNYRMKIKHFKRKMRKYRRITQL